MSADYWESKKHGCASNSIAEPQGDLLNYSAFIHYYTDKVSYGLRLQPHYYVIIFKWHFENKNNLSPHKRSEMILIT